MSSPGGDFTPWPGLNDSYRTETENDGYYFDGGMTLTDVFLDSVLSLPLVPPEIANLIDINDMGPFIEAFTSVDNIDNIVNSNWRYVTAIVFGAFMIVASVVTLVGYCVSK